MAFKKILTVLLSVAMVTSMFAAATVVNVGAGASTTFEAIDFDYNRENVYSRYIAQYAGVTEPGTEIPVNITSPSAVSDPAGVVPVETVDGMSNVLEFKEEVQWAEFTVNVPEDSLYSVVMYIRGAEGIKNDIEFSFSLNGEVPFNEAAAVQMFRGWTHEPTDVTEELDENGNVHYIFKEDRGNDLRPRQTENLAWRTEWIVDSAGLTDEPFKFYFTAGVNTIRIETAGEPFYIADMKLAPYTAPKPYAEVKAEYDQNGYKPASAQIKIQGEDAQEFSHSTLFPISVRNNSQIEPYHASKTRLNATGGANWAKARRWLKWDVNVPESGLYQIAIKFRQNEYEGMFATRSIYIDGEIPFEEFSDIRFNYGSDWQYQNPGADGEPYYVYLEKGTHEIKMQVTLGQMAPILEELTNVLYQVNNIYSQIVMIASTSPDTYRDYYFDRNIPGLVEDLSAAAATIREQVVKIKDITGGGSKQTASLEQFADQIELLAEDTDNFNKMLTAYKDNISTLSQWLVDNQSQSVRIDFFVLGGENMELPGAMPSFGANLVGGFKTFFASFVEDYNVIGEVAESSRKVRVWVGSGRDQVGIINGMIQDDFTPETGINIQLELVQGSLIEATLAGKGPDVSMMAGADQPVNFAIRGALVDLTQFEGFDEVYSRFNPAAFEAFKFQMNEDKQTGHVAVYAIPETQTYNMLFYRKDILAQLGLGVPQTWDDFFAMLPVLRRNNLQVGTAAITMYQALLYQNGGSYYTEDKKASGFSTEEAKQAFAVVADCFTKYDFPIAYDFYSRFRSGEMPLSIQPYTQYNLVNAAAPEIRGLWDMAVMPGTVREDGTVDHQQPVASQGCIMFAGTEDKEAAWEFIKWYTDAEAQTRYGLELEALLGAAGRYAAANNEAFENLAWTREQSKILSEQASQLSGIPEVPGSYYTARALTLAFNSAYVEMENPYKALSENTEDLDNEITRKYQEFGLE